MHDSRIVYHSNHVIDRCKKNYLLQIVPELISVTQIILVKHGTSVGPDQKVNETLETVQ